MTGSLEKGHYSGTCAECNEVKCLWCNKSINAPKTKEGWVCSDCSEGATTELVINK